MIPLGVKNELSHLRILSNPFSWVRGKLTPTDQLFLDINFKNYKKLEQKKDEALKIGVLIAEESDYVKGNISNRKNSVAGKIRLKGDQVDHFGQRKKWSFRVKVNDGKTINGMNKFSLHTPQTRNNIWEWIYFEFLRYEGLPSLKYFFADVTLNGNYLGLYAIEEHFDKILLESNKFKEGPIISLTEDSYWYYIAQANKSKTRPLNTGNDSFYNTEPKVFKEAKTLASPILKNQFQKASQLLEGFYTGKLTTSEVFPLETLAKYYVITDLSNSYHATRWHNQRFYYEPTSSLLIPLGFDGMGGPGNAFHFHDLSIDRHINGVNKELSYFDDPNFVKLYIENLERVSKPEYLDKFFLKINKELNYNVNVLRRDNPRISKNDIKEKLYKNQLLIKSYLTPPPNSLNIYLQEIDDKSIKLSIGNKQVMPIKLLGIYYKNNLISNLEDQEYIKSKHKDNFINYNEYKSKLNYPIEDINNLSIAYSILGSSKIKQQNIRPYSRLNSIDAKKDLIRSNSNLDKFPFIIHNEVDKILTFKSGNWVLRKPLIIPKLYKVKNELGFNITMKDDGLIYSKSSVNLIGSTYNPVKINGEGSTNGLVVINANDKSILNNVEFNGLSTPSKGLWSVPGSVTFYQSPVEILNCYFNSNNSEDSLNIVRSDFKLIDSKFNLTRSDAIDIDFSDGHINNIQITNAGNDGLDVSGSNIKVNNIKVNYAADKAISVGEASNIVAKDIMITNSGIAIASKDGSLMKASNVVLNSSKIGFAAFQKKAEYSPASIKLKNTSYNGIDNLFLLSEGSKLILNGTSYNPNSTNEVINRMVYKK
ncbi:Predicted protein [Prochlorococcus marinus subsp. marinus str. CCMP1375]|uniref:Right handed beta helix domain-containing protein n=2 Tax=Prochlorococcaceae TaxID=2881426 RepID=Q7VB35_PROMA|nr:Predicted protein [Prochlorococcus marinus subsp. marinus str. CCMP1375]